MITFLINELNIRGGTHKQFLYLLKYTASQNVDFKIITTCYEPEKTYPDFSKFEQQITVIPRGKGESIFSKLCNRLRFALKLRKELKQSAFINVHDPGFELFFLFFPSQRVIWQINDLPYYFNVGIFKNKTYSNIKNAILRKLAVWGTQHAVQKITVNVTKNKQRVEKYLQRPALVYYCGIEAIDVTKDINSTFERFAQKRINILSSGVFFPYRNYETQIAVIEQLLQKGINARLKIIGATSDKSYTNKIQELIKTKALSSAVTICGQVDEQTFKELHTNADIFMFINIDQSWGLAIFEAMSCGLPVIVSNSVGATEILTDQYNAIFVDPTDCNAIVNWIQKLMSDKSYYQTLSQYSKKLIQQYSWEESYCKPIFDLFSNCRNVNN